jgi:hypothetical protein
MKAVFCYNCKMKKRYEILNGLPATGPMYIPIGKVSYYSDHTEGFVVRFFKADDTDWVGNFKIGIGKLNAVYEFDNLTDLLVIAGGNCYLMNPEETTPKLFFGGDYQGAVTTDKGQLVLYNYFHLTIIETNGEYWHSEQISIDGIEEVQISGDMVMGVAYEPAYDEEEWMPFSYDITSRTLYTSEKNLKNRWWKFW